MSTYHYFVSYAAINLSALTRFGSVLLLRDEAITSIEQIRDAESSILEKLKDTDSSVAAVVVINFQLMKVDRSNLLPYLYSKIKGKIQ